jgi:hypothetical protein
VLVTLPKQLESSSTNLCGKAIRALGRRGCTYDGDPDIRKPAPKGGLKFVLDLGRAKNQKNLRYGSHNVSAASCL